MHEFDKCCFCFYHDPNCNRLDKCSYIHHSYCIDRSSFVLDHMKVINKSRQYDISVTDTLNLMREATK